MSTHDRPVKLAKCGRCLISRQRTERAERGTFTKRVLVLIELAAFPSVNDPHVATKGARLSERGSGINAHARRAGTYVAPAPQRYQALARNRNDDTVAERALRSMTPKTSRSAMRRGSSQRKMSRAGSTIEGNALRGVTLRFWRGVPLTKELFEGLVWLRTDDSVATGDERGYASHPVFS
jgi:hypothetical protein